MALNRRRWTALVAGVLVALLAIGCGTVAPPLAPPTPAPLVPLTFMAGFKTQANLPFVAVYLADSLGYFRDEGLAVTIQHSAGNSEHIPLLAAGRVQVATITGTDLVKRVSDPGVPLVAIALFGQRSDQAFVTLPGSGIASPRDWEGRLVGYKGTPGGEYLALLKAAGVDRSKLREVSVGFDPRILTEGRVDVYPVFESNEPFLLRRLGFDPQIVRPADFGVRTMGLTYVVERSWLDANPNLAERFLRAALKGARYAIDNPEAAVDEVLRRAPQEDREQQRYMLGVERAAALEGLASPGRVGSMQREQWQDLVRQLADLGVTTRPVDADRVFDSAPLEAALGR